MESNPYFGYWKFFGKSVDLTQNAFFHWLMFFRVIMSSGNVIVTQYRQMRTPSFAVIGKSKPAIVDTSKLRVCACVYLETLLDQLEINLMSYISNFPSVSVSVSVQYNTGNWKWTDKYWAEVSNKNEMEIDLPVCFAIARCWCPCLVSAATN